MIKKIAGFTLGEVLIALTVIGVVAVLVMPQLVLGQKAAKAKAQFDTGYSLVAKAIADMDSDDISTDPSKYPTRTFYPKFKEYNRFTVDCGVNNTSPNTSVCPSTTDYVNITGTTKISKDLLDDGALVLNNGMLMAVENCVGCSGYGPDHNLWVVVDINGKNNRPNRLGHDLFVLQILNGEVLPLGAPGTDALFSAKPEDYCCISSINKNCTVKSAAMNGYTCAFYAASDEEYFKKIYNGH